MNIIFEYVNKQVEVGSNKVLILPVNPENLKVNIPSDSQKVEVIGVGEVSVPQTRKLKSANITSLFWYDLFRSSVLGSAIGGITGFSGAVAGAVNSAINSGLNKVSGIIDDAQKFTLLNQYVKWIEEWQATLQPARFTVMSGMNEPPQCYDFYVTCENFNYELRAGESNDYYYQLDLLEWRDYGAKVLTEQKKSDGTSEYTKQAETRVDNKPVIKQKLCTAKDSIWSVAQKTGVDWKELYNEAQNKVLIAESPQNLAGLNLKIPKVV